MKGKPENFCGGPKPSWKGLKTSKKVYLELVGAKLGSNEVLSLGERFFPTEETPELWKAAKELLENQRGS